VYYRKTGQRVRVEFRGAGAIDGGVDRAGVGDSGGRGDSAAAGGFAKVSGVVPRSIDRGPIEASPLSGGNVGRELFASALV